MTDRPDRNANDQQQILLSFPQLSEAIVTIRSPHHRWLNMYRTFKVETRNVSAICDAITRVASRNTILRTYYVDADEPYQAVAETVEFKPEQIHHQQSNGIESAKRALLEWARSPIDVKKPGHFKIATLEVEEGYSLICFSVPHLSWDYQSWGFLLSQIDREISRGNGAPVPVRSIDYEYGNFALQQRTEADYPKLLEKHRKYANSVLRPDRRKGEIGRFLGITGEVPVPGPLDHVNCYVDALPPGLQGNEQALALAVIARSVATVLGIDVVPFAAPVDARPHNMSELLGFCVNVLHLNVPVDLRAPPSLPDISANRRLTRVALRYRRVPILPDTIDSVDDLPSDVAAYTLENGYDRGRSWDEIPFNFLRETSDRYDWIGEWVNLDSPAGISALYFTAYLTSSIFAVDLGYRTDLISREIAQKIIDLSSGFLREYIALLSGESA